MEQEFKKQQTTVAPDNSKSLWGQHVYVDFLNEVDPFNDLHRFRQLEQAYTGDNTFWSIPSPEPDLDESFWHEVMSELGNDAVRETARKLAAAIADWQPDPEKLIFVAILRAGVPIADWLCQMFPGSITAAISLFVGLGIDRIALDQLQSNFPERTIIFVDGWTGRGGVSREIAKLNAGPLAVLIDPWGWADFSGVQEDVFCPSACFTGVATLGFSRTFFVNDQNFFAAYKFPEKYTRKDIVDAWRKLSPKQPTTPGVTSIEKFYKSTDLRIHGNEVCRALINAAPETLFFADEQEYVKEHFSLLLALANRRDVPVKYNHKSLRDYRTRVACTLRNGV